MTKKITVKEVQKMLGTEDKRVIEACFCIFEHDGLIIREQDGSYTLTPKGLATKDFP